MINFWLKGGGDPQGNSHTEITLIFYKLLMRYSILQLQTFMSL